MLVLGRRVNETICIGDPRNPDGPPLAEITIVSRRDAQVNLGITAHRDVPIYRKEIYQRIQAGQPRPAKPAA